MRTELTLETLHEQIALLTGIPVEELSDPAALLERLPRIEAELRLQLIGQDAAVDAIMTALRARLLRENATRPILNLLCVGPSGVGKTETALQLARVCFGSLESLHRFDGSEYSEDISVSRLIGADPNYIGYGSGGQLTEAVRRQPRSVVLFDEIEKAAPTVRQLLLQTLDAGRLTDTMGQTVDFRRTMLVCTSNLGNAAVDRIPDPAPYEKQIRDALAMGLAPEFIGRFDAVVVYRHLDQAALERIVRLKLEQTARDVKGLAALHATDDAVSALAQEAYSPNSGAREIERVLRRRIDPGLNHMLEVHLLDAHLPVQVRLGYDGYDFLFAKV